MTDKSLGQVAFKAYWSGKNPRDIWPDADQSAWQAAADAVAAEVLKPLAGYEDAEDPKTLYNKIAQAMGGIEL
jgi:hypothetical protein